jgi:hypothetical protein
MFSSFFVNALYRASGRDGSACPVPRASCRMPLTSCTLHCAPLHLCASRPWTVGDLRPVALSSAPVSSSASMSLYWTAASRWAHITVCFMRFKGRLHMFYLDVAKVDLMLHMLQCLYMYVASVRFKCFSCLQMYVASGLSRCCICCTGYTRMLQAYVLTVSNVCCKCFIWMLHMLQWQYTYVASVCFQMFQLFQTCVASVLSKCCICCSGHTHMLQVYVLNVSSVFRHMLQQVLHVASVP